MKERLKALADQRGRLYVRRLGRLRLITKSRKAWATGSRPHREPGVWLREVILSPEVDTYSYALENVDEVATTLARALDTAAPTVRDVLDEALSDPDLGDRIAADIGHRALWLKRRPPLAGHHLAAWAIVRLTRPALVVETGILDGLGSRTILRALQRNGDEGHEGRLVSFDVLPAAGALVPDRLASRWRRVIEATETGLEGQLGGERVDVFLHDSQQTAASQRFEFGWALEHGVRVALTTADWTGVIDELAVTHGIRSAHFEDQPRSHFYGGRHIGLLVREP